MSEQAIARIFERLDGISDRLSRLEGICRARQFCPEEGRHHDHGDKKWLQWLVGALIGIIGSLVGVAVK